MSEIADILDRAADLIEPEGRWTQGCYTREADGRISHMGSATACKWCGAGAVLKASGLTRPQDIPALRFLGAQFDDDWGNFVSWNDYPDRTQAEVVAKLRQVAAKARRAANA